MHYDIHFRSDIKEKITEVVGDIHDWNASEAPSDDTIQKLAAYVTPFEHCVIPDRPFLMAGADGSGDFPCVRYGDSFVYLVTAMARLYEASASGKLIEQEVKSADVADFMWMPELKKDDPRKNGYYTDFFAQLVGEPLEDVVEKSDFYRIARKHGCSATSAQGLLPNLITPDAHDADNIGIQLLSTAECSVLIRLMQSVDTHGLPAYFIEDTTMSLPMLAGKNTLFFGILKRYACVVAREKGYTFMTLSKSHNMPHMDQIEEMIRTKIPSGEHWFMRIPAKSTGDTEPEFLEGRLIPPHGAVTYLFKLHKTTQPMRLDLDIEYWTQHIYSDDKAVQQQREIQLFRDIDFASHDQRCYGYPYPIKACHDMASMTDDERIAMRNQIINEAVKAGLKRKNFVDPSIPTGHK